MFTIGLTGGSGSGKGYAAKHFKRFGIDSIDTDSVSRNVCAIGKPCLVELTEYFGNGILLSNGELDRKKLGAEVFSDKQNLCILNKITHRYILDECTDWLRIQAAEGKFAAIIDAPLLFESGFNYRCDYIVSVVSDYDTRIMRITERDGISAEQARLRIQAQHNNNFFIEKSDFIIYNGAGDTHVGLQVDIICQNIRWM